MMKRDRYKTREIYTKKKKPWSEWSLCVSDEGYSDYASDE